MTSSFRQTVDSDEEGIPLWGDMGEDEDETLPEEDRYAPPPEVRDDGRDFMCVRPWLDSTYAPDGPKGMPWKPKPDHLEKPVPKLELEYVFGYSGQNYGNNAHWVEYPDIIVFHCAAIGVVYKISSNDQSFFTGHDDDIMCLDYHPKTRTVASGSLGAPAQLCIWEITKDIQCVHKFTAPCKNAPRKAAPGHFQHHRAVLGVAINPQGTHVASFGWDDNHSVAVYEISTGLLLYFAEGSKSRLINILYNTCSYCDSETQFITVGDKEIIFWSVEGAVHDPTRKVLKDHDVEPGETINIVALRYGVCPDSIRAANAQNEEPLPESNDAALPGTMTLKVPPGPRYHNGVQLSRAKIHNKGAFSCDGTAGMTRFDDETSGAKLKAELTSQFPISQDRLKRVSVSHPMITRATGTTVVCTTQCVIVGTTLGDMFIIHDPIQKFGDKAISQPNIKFINIKETKAIDPRFTACFYSLVGNPQDPDCFISGGRSGDIEYWKVQKGISGPIPKECPYDVVRTDHTCNPVSPKTDEEIEKFRTKCNQWHEATDNVNDFLVNSVRSMSYSSGHLLVGTCLNHLFIHQIGSQPTDKTHKKVVVGGHWGNMRGTDRGVPGEGELWALDTHPAGHILVSACEDATLRLWKVGLGENRLRNHGDWLLEQNRKVTPGQHYSDYFLQLKYRVRSVAFSKDARFIAVGYYNGGFSIIDMEGWDLREEGHTVEENGGEKYDDTDGKEFHTKFMRTRNRRIICVKFSPDCKYLITSPAALSADVWRINEKPINIPSKGPAPPAKTKSAVEFLGKLRGNSAAIISVDWNVHSTVTMTVSRSYEVLFYSIPDCVQILSSRAMRNEIWDTISCPMGWSVQGIWPPFADGSDINTVSRSKSQRLLITGDDCGKVKMFRYPCVGGGTDYRGHMSIPVTRPDYHLYRGHSSHVTCASWSYDDKFVLTAGGHDLCILKWKVVWPPGQEPDPQEYSPERVRLGAEAVNDYSPGKMIDDLSFRAFMRQAEDERRKEDETKTKEVPFKWGRFTFTAKYQERSGGKVKTLQKAVRRARTAPGSEESPKVVVKWPSEPAKSAERLSHHMRPTLAQSLSEPAKEEDRKRIKDKISKYKVFHNYIAVLDSIFLKGERSWNKRRTIPKPFSKKEMMQAAKPPVDETLPPEMQNQKKKHFGLDTVGF